MTDRIKELYQWKSQLLKTAGYFLACMMGSGTAIIELGDKPWAFMICLGAFILSVVAMGFMMRAQYKVLSWRCPSCDRKYGEYGLWSSRNKCEDCPR